MIIYLSAAYTYWVNCAQFPILMIALCQETRFHRPTPNSGYKSHFFVEEMMQKWTLAIIKKTTNLTLFRSFSFSLSLVRHWIWFNYCAQHFPIGVSQNCNIFHSIYSFDLILFSIADIHLGLMMLRSKSNGIFSNGMGFFGPAVDYWHWHRYWPTKSQLNQKTIHRKHIHCTHFPQFTKERRRRKTTKMHDRFQLNWNDKGQVNAWNWRSKERQNYGTIVCGNKDDEVEKQNWVTA